MRNIFSLIILVGLSFGDSNAYQSNIMKFVELAPKIRVIKLWMNNGMTFPDFHANNYMTSNHTELLESVDEIKYTYLTNVERNVSQHISPVMKLTNYCDVRFFPEQMLICSRTLYEYPSKMYFYEINIFCEKCEDGNYTGIINYYSRDKSFYSFPVRAMFILRPEPIRVESPGGVGSR